MGIATETIDALDLWKKITDIQTETGGPYMMYKDSCNQRSNQKHNGTITNSNLCAEIVEYTNRDEIAVCNLASVALPSFVKNGTFDFELLHKVVKIITRNMNKIIDQNYYPVPQARKSNMRHRPIGIGVQGLADTFFALRYAFDSDEAAVLNRQIFETIYHAALDASCDLAKRDGPYESYEGSPASKGQLQFDMWGVTPSNRWDWDRLKKRIQDLGIRNSLLTALMPTASTSQILGFNECFEPITSVCIIHMR